MENASKALIIAGAILIAILLISVGILIMNSTGSVKDQVESQEDSMAIQSFNAQFILYEGKGKTASQVRQLISVVNVSNKLNGHKVTFAPIGNVNPSLGNTVGTYIFKNSEKYNISMTDMGTSTVVGNIDTNIDGYIDLITISVQ